MAKLPDAIQLATPNGTDPNPGAVAPATDYGLGEVGQDLGQWAAAAHQTSLVRLQLQKQADQQTAHAVVRAKSEEMTPALDAAGAAYEGREPGWARAQADAFDAHFKDVTARPDLAPGVQFALRREIDAYKSQYIDHATSIEGAKRGSLIADHQQAVESGHVVDGEAAWRADFSARNQARHNAWTGATGDFAAGTLQDIAEAKAAAMANAPPDAADALSKRIDAVGSQEYAKSLEVQDRGATAFLANKAQTGLSTLANHIQSNPALFDSSEGSLDAIMQGLPGELRVKAIPEARSMLATSMVEGLIQRGDFQLAQAKLDGGKLDGWLEPNAKARLVEQVKSRAGVAAGNMIEALSYGADVNTDALVAAARASGDPGTMAHADYQMEVGASKKALTGALLGNGMETGFRGAADFVVDNLEGGATLVANDNGRGPTKFGINQTANPELNVSGLTRGMAMNTYRGKYWNAIGGDRLPPALAFVAFDAAVNQGVGNAQKWLSQSNGDPGQYLKLRDAAYRALAAKPGQSGNLATWEGRLKKVSAHAATLQAYTEVQSGLAEDPIKAAMGDSNTPALAPVVAMPLDSSDPAAFATALQSRWAVGQQLVATYKAPLRLLTKSEAAGLADQVQRDPAAGIALAESALKAIGPQGATALMSQLGGAADAPSIQVHIADLAAGGSPAFARSAADGLALKAKGQTGDPPKLHALDAAFDPYGAQFATIPTALLAIRQTAALAMLADQAKGVDQPASYYVHGAFGMTQSGGRFYGGPAKLNGGAVILPRWLNADYADDALETLARDWEVHKAGPVYASGAPIPAGHVARLRPVQMADGNYQLLDPRTGSVAMNRNGRPFEIDMDKAQPYLGRVLGGRAVRGAP